MTEWLTLSDLPPAAQDAIVTVLADEAEQSGDTAPLERALAGGDLLAGRDPAAVPRHVREAIAQVLTACLEDDDVRTARLDERLTLAGAACYTPGGRGGGAAAVGGRRGAR